MTAAPCEGSRCQNTGDTRLNALGITFLMGWTRWWRLYSMLVPEWERIKTKDWFHRQPLTASELEQRRFWILAREAWQLATGRHSPRPAYPLKRIMLDKERELAELPLEEHLRQGLFRQILEPALRASYSKSVHSFIKGRSVTTAFDQITKDLRRYRKATRQKERALYVLRADIKQCGESIPVHPKSRLWTLLRDRLPPQTLVPESRWFDLLVESIRPILHWKGRQGEFCLLRGVPTGAPLQPLILNLYLSQIDHYFESFRATSPHMIYSRYGDDFFFAHPDVAVLEQAKTGFFKLVCDLELETRPEKIQCFRWSGSGFQGKSMVEFLGFDLHFNGLVRLNRKKQKEAVRHIRRIVEKTFSTLKTETVEIRLEYARRMFERSIARGSPFRHPYLERILQVANDRAQLLELDHEITSALARAVTGIHHPAAFRKMRKRTLYQHFKIPSLVAIKNQMKRFKAT